MSPIDRKALAFRSFDENEGDIRATYEETGIPQRTLYSWRREWLEQPTQQQFLPMLSSPLPDFDNEVDMYRHVRRTAIAKVKQLLQMPIPQNRFKFDEHIRAITLLLDLIIKLTGYLGLSKEEEQPPQPEFPTRISLRPWYESYGHPESDQ